MSFYLHTRSVCDACRINRATVERSGCWFCAACDTSIIPVASVFPDSDVNVTAATLMVLAPASVGAVTTNSNTPEAPGTAREAPSTGCGTSSDVGSQTAPRPILDLMLPDFLRRGADNVPPFARSASNRASLNV